MCVCVCVCVCRGRGYKYFEIFVGGGTKLGGGTNISWHLPSGPAVSPSGFNLFLFGTSWNHFGFKIYCQNSRETTYRKDSELSTTEIQLDQASFQDSWVSKDVTVVYSTSEFFWVKYPEKPIFKNIFSNFYTSDPT